MRTKKASRKHHKIEYESGFIGARAAVPVNAVGAPDPTVEFEEPKLRYDADAVAADPDDFVVAAAASAPTKDAGTTIPSAPGMSVCPAMTYAPAGLGVMVWEPMVRRGRDAVGLRGIVLVPITNCVAEGARLSRVPETVIAGPPGVSVCPAMTYAPAALGVMVWEPIVRVGGWESGAVGLRGIVLVPMRTSVPLGARLSRVPETMIARPPGVSVWPSIT